MLEIISYKDASSIQKRLLSRGEADYVKQQKIVDKILEDVEATGDAALFEYTKQLDSFDVSARNIEVTTREIEQAYKKVDAELLAVMQEAVDNITTFHKKQLREDWSMERSEGATLGQLFLPIDSAGVYVPGGTAAYPSSVLMNIIPAKCAGVPNICVATPAPGGEVAPATLVAADLAGADKIFKMGGAQAIAAFAYGTDTIPKVDKITGPGNIYVALAKKSVYGLVGIDMIAGPSEVLVIADKRATVPFIAADFLSQAEHDELAACILVTDSETLAKQARDEIIRQASQLERSEIVDKSLEKYGTIILCENLKQCAEISNMIAPEHLEICTANPVKMLSYIRHAGSIFLGEYSPEPLGDYFAGTNHVLPTNGTARFSSPLNVDDFQKKSSVIYYTKEAFKKEYKKVVQFAEAEGLTAHAKSAAIRFEE